MWSYFEALGILKGILKKGFKYDGHVYMWWKPKKGRMDGDLRPLTEDRHALQLAKYVENKKKRLRYMWIIWLVLLKSLNLLKE